ncbi:hypothetical protein BDF21DRAFT_405176 [Thamnidium elegans]|nr:hypothetical protein BDF21DRAFT_405176 [Thamnidium elegans]
MLPIAFIALFLGSSFLSLFSDRTTTLFPACPGSSFWDTKSYCTFVPTVASGQGWQKTFLVEVCKSLSPRDLLKEALPSGVCPLAEEPKGLKITPPPPPQPFCPVSSRPFTVCPLPSCSSLSPSSPPSPLPSVCNTGWKPTNSFASTAKELSKENQSGFFYPDNEMMLFITSLTIVYIIGNRMARY